jgi:hypothetical protein
MPSWKRTANQYREDLLTELGRMKAPRAVVSSNVPVNLRGLMQAGVEPRDVGVAVYFTREKKEDFSWQDVLNIPNAIAATEEQVQSAYRRLAQQYHPDRGGDLAMFQTITQARDNAVRWINRNTQPYDYVIACDEFSQVRLNMAAIVFTIRAIRQIERCGTSTLLERAFKGFAALNAAPDEAEAAVR